MHRCTHALAATVALTSTYAAHAAEAPTTLALEEIVVTAQKREQSTRDVPISLTVVSGAAIQDRVLADLADLSRTVPNISINNAALNNLVFVRGIGSGSNVGFEQSVGLFVDEVYLSR